MSDKPRLQLDPEASRELEALLDDIHGPERPTVGNGTFRAHELRPCICADPENCKEVIPGYLCRKGNGTYRDPWTHTTEGDEAGDEPCLHVTVEGDVWLNPTRTKFDGLCIGAGDHPIEDAVLTLERALQMLYAFPKRGA